ncbi:FKBP-type peptidylprolyl isomerase [Mucilaginibacter hurinus]|uniref:peptidylprolyl isomerase n=1 Tax=Mucilaginibacter hurinus TaxID=2201324 RepID=A0A367GRN2_9SPHI|nr:FKBP-type peptidyl-prolyl cis-trans isomerase [Mucilaginibacter hurinus]RCH55496.1 FKBP-type peptidylprolyl isomerase [Mucilaginibacter hurinus]
MKKNLMILGLAAIGLASCKGGFKEAPGGLLYNIHTDKEGPVLKEGDFMSVNVVAKNDADSVMMNTYDLGRPMPSLMQKPQSKGDIYAGLGLLSEGDSATIKVNADSVFTKDQPKPPGFKGKYLVYQIKVEKVIAKGKLNDTVFNGRINDYLKTVSENTKKREPGILSKYVADKGLKTTTTPSGLQYVITKQGSGPKIAAGDTAVVNYLGKLPNDKVFDTSIKEEVTKAQSKKLFVGMADPNRKYEPIRIPVGEGRVIQGWDEGLQLLNKGAKATFVIPSNLAYGEQGAQNIIPPFMPIVFEVELVDIVKPNPNAAKPMAPPVSQAPAKK